MTTTVCRKHPAASGHRGYCAACLIEEALATSADEHVPENGERTTRVPLGHSRRTSVFVVESHAGLRRLKTWRVMAPSTFLEGFHDLRRRLHAWSPTGIALPVDAFIDEAGHPTVLSEFRQGLPLLESVAAGRLACAEASSLLQQLGELLTSAHDRGLVHGSVKPGNILVTRDRIPWFLDFGMAPLLSPTVPLTEWVQRDLDEYARRASELPVPGL